MDWEAFKLEHPEKLPDVISLDENHILKLTYGNVETWDDAGLAGYVDDDNGHFVLVGGIMNHRKPDGSTCGGGISFARPKNPSEHEKSSPLWTVSVVTPITMEPSILCHCGEHGFIRQGKWIPA